MLSRFLLVFLICAAFFWSAAACGGKEPEVPTEGQTPVVEATGTPTAQATGATREERSTFSMPWHLDPCGIHSPAKEKYMTEPSERELLEQQIKVVREKYEALIERQPTWHGTGTGNLKDADRQPTGPLGIIIHVERKVDQNTLPPEDRIPDCLDGIPVQIIESGLDTTHAEEGR